MAGVVAILNVGAGDTKLLFDPKKPAEVKRAARIVKDMIRSGYAILIEAIHSIPSLGPQPMQPRVQCNGGKAAFDPRINHHTGQPHEHKREIARRLKRGF